MIKPYETINSFTRRPVITQLIAYLVFIGEALTFFICMYVNFTNSTKQIAILVLYIATAVVQIVVTLITSYIDPSDNVMMEYRKDEKSRKKIELQFRLFCEICTGFVKQTSRHCKVCQRCVQKFDHHCMWINNCIGGKNYNIFIVMIISTFVNMVVYVIGMILLWTDNGWRQYIGPMVTVWVYSVLILVFTVLLFNLITLHMYLIYKGLTTHQFIMIQRGQQMKKQVQKQEQKKLKDLLQKQKNSKDPSTQYNIPSKQSIISNQLLSFERSQAELSKTKLKTRQNRQQSEVKSMGSTSNIIINDKIQPVPAVEAFKEELESQVKSVRFNDNMFKNRQKGLSVELKLDQMDEQNPNNISDFFVKNKSLSFFIGTEVGGRPKSAIQMKTPFHDLSLAVPKKQSTQFMANENISQIQSKKSNNNLQIGEKSRAILYPISFQQSQTQVKSKGQS